MPLKKPDLIPKIPHTRKKKAEAAKTAVPKKKKDKIEYVCRAAFRYDEMLKQELLVLSVQTVVAFSSFAYEITIDVREEKSAIDLTLMGLKAKPNYIPQIAPAQTDIPFKHMFGEYTVSMIKQDGCINSAVYRLNRYMKEIKILKEFMPPKKNNRHFCRFEVAEDEFTFSENDK